MEEPFELFEVPSGHIGDKKYDIPHDVEFIFSAQALDSLTSPSLDSLVVPTIGTTLIPEDMFSYPFDKIFIEDFFISLDKPDDKFRVHSFNCKQSFGFQLAMIKTKNYKRFKKSFRINKNINHGFINLGYKTIRA